MDGKLFTAREESAEETVFFPIFFNADDLEYSEDTYHEESVLVSMMWCHKCWYLSTELCHEDKEDEYCYHEHTAIGTCPISECWVIWTEILGLEPSKSAYNSDKEECKYTWFRNAHNRRFCNLGESLLEHLECREEDDEKSKPLDRWILLKHLCDIVRCNDHEDDGDNESYHEIDDISMTCTCNCEDIVERHCDICDDNGFDSFTESCCCLSSFFVMLMCAYLAVELPYDVEEEYRTEELESRNLEEEYYPKWEYDTEDRCTSYSPKYCFFAHLGREILGCHTYEDGIISTHDKVDEDDIEQCKSTCRGKKMHEVWLKSHDEFWHSKRVM